MNTTQWSRHLCSFLLKVPSTVVLMQTRFQDISQEADMIGAIGHLRPPTLSSFCVNDLGRFL